MSMGGSDEKAREQQYFKRDNRGVCWIFPNNVDDVAWGRLVGGHLWCKYLEFDLLGERKKGGAGRGGVADTSARKQLVGG